MGKVASLKEFLNPIGTKGFGAPFALLGAAKNAVAKKGGGVPAPGAPPAPPTAANAAAVQAAADARRKAKEKAGLASTILGDSDAGSGGLGGGLLPTSKNNLLGGG